MSTESLFAVNDLHNKRPAPSTTTPARTCNTQPSIPAFQLTCSGPETQKMKVAGFARQAVNI